MPVVRGLDGAWVLPPAIAAKFVPILRAEIDRQRRQGVTIDPVILAELRAGEAAAAHGSDRTGQTPDEAPDGKAPFRTLGTVKGLRAAAEIAGVPRSTLAGWVAAGTVSAKRHGHVLVFDVGVLEEVARWRKS